MTDQEKISSDDKIHSSGSIDLEKDTNGEVLTTYLSPFTGKRHEIDADEAMKVALQLKEKGIELDEETDRKLTRKLYLNVFPLICFLYACQFMDKVTNSYAAVMGLKTDLNMKGDMYSWSGTAFYLGYLAFEFPATAILQRFPLAKTTATFVIIWGVLLCLHSVPNYAGFIALRTLLGVFVR